VIGAKVSQLFLDSVENERAPKFHAELADQLDENVDVDVRQNLILAGKLNFIEST
jgi:hypothetical protein